MAIASQNTQTLIISYFIPNFTFTLYFCHTCIILPLQYALITQKSWWQFNHNLIYTFLNCSISGGPVFQLQKSFVQTFLSHWRSKIVTGTESEFKVAPIGVTNVQCYLGKCASRVDPCDHFTGVQTPCFVLTWRLVPRISAYTTPPIVHLPAMLFV